MPTSHATKNQEAINPPLSQPHAHDRRACNHLIELIDRYRWWVFAALIVLYLAGFNGQWHVEPDSALYLTIARNLATGQGYTYHGQVDHLAYPGWPMMVAATFRLFGIGNLWPAHALMLLFAFLSLGLTYRLIHLHADRPTAVATTALLGFNVCFYQYTYQLRNDMPFLVGVLVFLVGYEQLIQRERRAHRQTAPLEYNAERTYPPARPGQRWTDWLFMLGGLGLAVIMRPTMIALVGCIAMAALYSTITRRGHWRRLMVAGLVLLAVAAFFWMDPRHQSGGASLGGYEDDMMGIFTRQDRLLATASKAVHEYIPQLLRSTTAASFGHELGPGLNVVGTLLLLALGIHLIRRRPLWGLWIAATVGMMLLTIPRDRYFLPVLPLLAFAWWRFIVWLNRRSSFSWGNILFCLLLATWLGPNTVKTINAAIQQHRTPFLHHYKSGKLDHIAQFAHALAKLPQPPGRILMAPEGLGRILTYYSGLYVLDYWQYPPDFPPGVQVYCIFPPDPKNDKLQHWIDEHHALVAPALLTVKRSDRAHPKLQPWALHRLRPPATTTSPTTP